MTKALAHHQRFLIQIPAFMLLTLMLLGFVSPSFASTKSDAKGEFAFVFKPIHGIKLPETAGKNPKLELRIQGNSYEEAYRQAAQECFRYFKGGQKLSENDGLSIIDICANPRGS